MATKIFISTEVDTKKLAYEIAQSDLTYDELVKFVLELDGSVGDCEFTRMLKEALDKEAEECEKL